MNPNNAYFFAAFFHSLFVNLAINFYQSILITKVSGQAYSRVFFFSTLISIFCYLGLSRTPIGKQVRFHGFMVLFSFVGTAVLSLSGLRESQFLILAFGVVIVLEDMLAPGILSSTLSEETTPAKFARISHRILKMQLYARVGAALLVIGIARLELFAYFGVFTGVAAFMHLWFLLQDGRERPKFAVPQGPALSPATTSETFRFLWKNPLIRVATLVSIWGYCTKYLVDLSLMQATQLSSQSLEQSATILGQVSIVSIVAIYFFQLFFSRRLMESRPLSHLLAMLPVATLIFSLGAFLHQSIYVVAAMVVVYQMISRTIQGTAIRQLFFLAPTHLRNSVFQISLLHLSIISALLSGGLSLFKNSWTLESTLLLTISMCILVFFVITEVDNYFLRNMWSQYKQSNSGRWLDRFEKRFRRNFSDILPKLHGSNVPPREIRQLLPMAYEVAKTKNELEIVSRYHKSLLRTSNREAALDVFYLTGLPEFRQVLAQFKDQRAVELLSLWQKLESWVRAFQLASPTRRKLRLLTLEANDSELAKLDWLLKSSSPSRIAAFVDILHEREEGVVHEYAFECLNFEGREAVHLNPMLEAFERESFSNSLAIREALERLGSQYSRRSAWAIVESNMKECTDKRFSLFDEDPVLRDKLLKALFLEEWLLDRSGKNAYLRETLVELSSNPSRILLELHIEALKHSKRLPVWRNLLHKNS